jgi:protein TonB
MGVPNRLSGSLPVSIAAHVVAICLLVVIPLTAQISLPMLPSSVDAYIRAVPAPPPPPAPVVPAAARAPQVSRIPIEAPPAIVPEHAIAPADVPDAVAGGVDFGTPGLVGSPAGEVPLPPVPPPPPPKPAGPVHVGELVRAPQKIVDVRPVYPEFARVARVQGTVVLEAVLDKNGRVEQVRVLKSAPLLDQAAIDAVRRWQYTPSTLHGVPVEVLMTITVTFNLQE